MVGDYAAIKQMVTQLKTKVSLKDVGPLSEYVGCTMVKDPHKQKLWMWQPDLLLKMERIFKQPIEAIQKYKTPAAPGHIIMKSENPSEVVDAETHSLYRSDVGMLLFLVKFSRPEMSNVIREAAKVNVGPTKAHMKSLYRLIKYVVNTKLMDWLWSQNNLQKIMCGKGWLIVIAIMLEQRWERKCDRIGHLHPWVLDQL
jgi:hypothetical protein